MTATKLRYVLIAAILLTVGGFGAAGWWAQQVLAQKARETDHARIDADLSSLELQQLRRLKTQLEQQQEIIGRAQQIAATAEQYRYQDQVISDIQQYAGRYGIQISNFDFGAKAGSKSSDNTSNKTAFTITLRGPLAYDVFLKFLRDLEANLTKLQITSLTLAPDKNPTLISNPSISLEVFLKR